MTCVCGHNEHAFDEPTVCKDIFCNCEQYLQSAGDDQMIAHWDKYIKEMDDIKKQVRWVLTNLKYTRNLNNDDFVDFFTSKMHCRKYETIRRSKQALARSNKALYGKFECPELEKEMAFKQLGITEWARAQ